MVSRTHESYCSSFPHFYGISVLSIVDILSFRRPSILGLLKHCRYESFLVTRIKNEQIGIASTITLSGIYH